ncbi:hypothetical protein JZO73_01115 [Enterococcus plantarum]|uniref:hypothetical protein n=1 Tax=Enterococcus plantarum TaxID=1077675 RepID=UPI001A8CE763|nr:hypothetical protein [Enterococcus plantarum]MBO0466127.1 hypothetical protein [Enterococcus plantarum]
MQIMSIHKSQKRDTSTLSELGMVAYRIFSDTGCINIQLLSGKQEERTIPFKDGEVVRFRDVDVRLDVID